MENKRFHLLVTAFPVIFLLHDLEEIFTIENFLSNHTDQIPFKVTTLEFTLAFLLLWIFTFIGCKSVLKNRTFLWMRPLTFFTLLVPGILFANGIGHILQFFFFQEYVPGLITTICILFPYCFLSIRFLIREKYLSKFKLMVFFLIGFGLQTIFAFGAIIAAKGILTFLF